jgi:hypothetical protein
MIKYLKNKSIKTLNLSEFDNEHNMRKMRSKIEGGIENGKFDCWEMDV